MRFRHLLPVMIALLLAFTLVGGAAAQHHDDGHNDSGGHHDSGGGHHDTGGGHHNDSGNNSYHNDPGHESGGSYHNSWEQATLTTPASEQDRLTEPQAPDLIVVLCDDNDNLDPVGTDDSCGQEETRDDTP